MSKNTFVISSNEQTTLFIPFSETDPVYVREIGYHATPPSHTFGPATRQYYLLHLIESGKGEIEREGKTVPLSAGEAFLICPDEVTTYRADANEPWTYRWISFHGAFAKTLVEHTSSKLCMKCRKSGFLALKNMFENRISDPIGSLNTLFTVLDAIKTESKTATADPVSVAMRYLENNYFEPVAIEELAFQLGFSRAYFSTLFHEKTGETPYAYLTKIRVQHAASFLAESDRSVEEIGYSVGFSSLQRFSESFKKYTGLSPMQYRKSLAP